MGIDVLWVLSTSFLISVSQNLTHAPLEEAEVLVLSLDLGSETPRSQSWPSSQPARKAGIGVCQTLVPLCPPLAVGMSGRQVGS